MPTRTTEVVHNAPDAAEVLAGGVGAGVGGGAVYDLVRVVDVAAGVGVGVEDEVAHGLGMGGERGVSCMCLGFDFGGLGGWERSLRCGWVLIFGLGGLVVVRWVVIGGICG